MPNVVDNGLNFLRFIKRSGHDCAVLGVTGYRPLGSDQSARDLFKSYGVRNILTKPFDVDTLTDEVGRSGSDPQRDSNRPTSSVSVSTSKGLVRMLRTP